MKYSEADTLATTLVRALVDSHQTQYQDIEERYSQSYALGYLTSMLASLACNNPDVAERLQDSLVSTQRYTESLK
jgi:hypothetical protein